ncbi:hypothetical protein LCGC14_0733490 [marine sediment metagenome]|uniref:Carboxypeptidase regulatory-like domain-containing protein n=1 Tax=marine sediment metagenome TaxID=412755 RepID=A0A0F9QTT5_9ZZZZ|nr:MAG: hypothetical protein Lokiarch_30110 [Candidatus Lokiarchaeum sp. GC14_75]
MSKRNQIYSIVSIRTLLIVLLIGSFAVPLLIGNLKTNYKIEYSPPENTPGSSEFTKDNYSAILTTDDYGLGTVSIDDMHFNEFRLGIVNHSINYPLLDNDLFSGALNMSVTRIEFIETLNPAIHDNLNRTNNDNTITVKLNESISVLYKNPQEGYLIYFSHFSGAKLLKFYVDNGTSIINLTKGIDYTIDDIYFIVFDYEQYFQQGPTFNFTMHLIWEYKLLLEGWEILQTDEAPLIMNENEQNFTSSFAYIFYLLGYIVLPDLSGTILIDYINVALTISPLDKELFSYQELNINFIDKNINDYLNPDKSLSFGISDLLIPNRGFIIFNFTISFGLKFEEPVGYSWGIDRLVAKRNIRERIYFISMVTGPPHIFLKNVVLYETAIPIDQVVEVSSLFNREVLFFDANASVPRHYGLKVDIPYLIVGETCPISIKYLATQTLTIVVTDTIKMPLVGANVEILYFGAMYGTYISNKSVQPINPGRTDENGQVVLYDVPRGNYTVRIIWQGKLVKETTVNTDKEVNYVFTRVPHFPLWILIFGITTVITTAVGLMYYLKNKKLR